MGSIGSDRTPSMAKGQEIAFQALLHLNQLTGSGLEESSRSTFMQQIGQTVMLENVAEPELGITGHPAVTL